MAEGKIIIRGDGASALGMFKSLDKGAHSLSHELNTGVRKSMIEAFSVKFIGEAFVSLVEFSDQTVKSAEALDVTTDSFQALKIAAREAGKDMSIFEKGFNAIEKAASAALGGDSKTHKAFQNLGISDADLKNLDKVALLQKILQGTQGQSRNQAAGNLNALGIRSKDANGLLAVQPQLADFSNFKSDLKANGQITSNDDLNNLADLKDKWSEFTDEVKTSAIPAVTWLLDVFLRFGRGVSQLARLVGTAIGALLGNLSNFDFGGLIKGFGTALFDGFKSLFENLWNVIRGKISVADALGNISNIQAQATGTVLQGAFGKEGTESIAKVINDQLDEFNEEDKKNAAAEDARKQHRADAEAAKTAPANRAATVKGDGKSLLDNELKGDNGLLKIGGLGGVDTAYRLERLSKQANDYLKTIALNTTPVPDSIDNNGGDGEFSD